MIYLLRPTTLQLLRGLVFIYDLGGGGWWGGDVVVGYREEKKKSFETSSSPLGCIDKRQLGG